MNSKQNSKRPNTVSIFFLLSSTLLISACDQHLKPYYTFEASTPIYQYQGGDELVYSVLDMSSSSEGDSLGSYTRNFSNTTQLTLSTSIETIQENFSGNQNFSPPFITRHINYNDQGDMELVALAIGDELFWLTENDELSGVVLYFAQVDEIQENNYNFTRELQICNESRCEDSGTIEANYAYLKEELAKTSFADFDTHAMNVSIAINIHQNALSETNKNHRLLGTEWHYPPLGVVKYEYDIESDSEQVTLLGHLSRTNINIPEALKQKN